MSCEQCEDAVLFFLNLERLADDYERHDALFRCPNCGTFYEIFPEVKQPATELTEEEARQRFPGALRSGSRGGSSVGNEGRRRPPEDLVAEAKKVPGGWVYEVVPGVDPRGRVAAEQIVGAWVVDDEGALTGEFVPNPKYLPPNREP